MALGRRLLVAALVAPGLLAAAALQSYDYVVIGAGVYYFIAHGTNTIDNLKGTAGSTLAARIAEDPSVTVAVLEAGDALSRMIHWPSFPGRTLSASGRTPCNDSRICFMQADN
jgi:hypothetical protein